MENTSGFYKLDGDILYGHGGVYGPDYTLLREDHTTYAYPVSGWYWFDTEADARTFFGLPPALDEEIGNAMRRWQWMGLTPVEEA